MVNEEYSKPKKRHTGLVVFIVLIAGLLIGTGGCYYYFEYMVPKPKTTVKKCDKTKKFEDTKLDVNSNIVQTLVSRYDAYISGSNEIFDNLYKKDVNSITDIKSEIRTLMAYNNIGIGSFGSFTSDTIKASYEKLFGQGEPSYIDGDFAYGCGTYKYDNVEKKYTYNPSAGCGTTSTSELVRKITDAKIKDNYLYINAAVGFKGAKENSTDIVISNRSGEIDDIDPKTFNIDKDYKKLDQVQYKFAYDEDNYNFYLVSIKKTNIE